MQSIWALVACTTHLHLVDRAQVVGWKLHPPQKNYAEFLTPYACEYDLIWTKFPCRCDQIKIRSYKIHPKSNDWCLYRRSGRFSDRDTAGRKASEARGRLQLCSRVTRATIRAGRGSGGFPGAFRGSMALSISLQDCEKIHFCYFKPHRLLSFVTAALRD